MKTDEDRPHFVGGQQRRSRETRLPAAASAAHGAVHDYRAGHRRGEIGFWTAADARGLGIAPAALRAVTDWAFGAFGASGLPRIMLVHDLDNPASCRVAAKGGYPFHELSPANPPYWFTDGHIHVAEATDL
jgi:GNAT superfamily N-acetyltransferase